MLKIGGGECGRGGGIGEELRIFFSSFLTERDLLIKKIIEVKLEKSDEIYFQVCPSYHDSVYTLIMNNTVDDKIRKIVSTLT